MHPKTHPLMISLLMLFILLTAYPIEATPIACDCSTTEVSDQEATKGCPKEVKKEFCDLVHQRKIWKERISQQREDRRKLINRPIR